MRNSRLVDGARHLDRLQRSLDALSIPDPMARGPILRVIAETLNRNRISDGIVYLQVTRGVFRREHTFPKISVKPSLILTARRGIGPAPRAADEGVAVAAVPDKRWSRCDIKSVGLLPNVVAKQEAKEKGAYEAWLVDRDGNVTEGGSTNAWIVDAGDALVTHPADATILNGITRLRIIELARAAGLTVIERPFSLDEAKSAREAFLTSTTSYVLPIVKIDDRPVGNGHPGEAARSLLGLYELYAANAGENLP